MSERPAEISVSVVIPIHNEADYLPGAIPNLFDELRQVPAKITVLLAENGSTDGTAEVASGLMQDYPDLDLLELPAPDYGGAMKAGFLVSEADWVVNFDIDYFSGTFLVEALKRSDEADVVLASKRTEGSEDRRSSFRRFATFVFNLMLKFVLGSGVSDTHGMKALRADVVRAIAPTVISTEDLFDTELVIRAERAGYRIVELPVTVEDDRAARSSLLKRVPRTLRGVWKIRRDLR